VRYNESKINNQKKEMKMSKKKELELCAGPDTNGARAYTESNPFDERLCDAKGKQIKYGMRVSIDGRGSWRVIDIHCESGDIGLDSRDGILYVSRSKVVIVD
jgi:hypothetical protein